MWSLPLYGILSPVHEEFPAPEGELSELVPVFPLPGAVLFPATLMPLHIFEERYLAMMKDVLESDGLIAMALLKACTKEEYDACPPFYETLCVGRVVHHEPLVDGRFNIVLAGLTVARAVEIRDDRPYRRARMELLPDHLDQGSEFDDRLDRVFHLMQAGDEEREDLRTELANHVRPEEITAAMINTCAQRSNLAPLDKASLLEERELGTRLDKLIRLLERPWQWN